MLRLGHFGQDSLAQLLRMEPLMNNLQRIADHVILFAQGTEAGQDLVIDSLRQ